MKKMISILLLFGMIGLSLPVLAATSPLPACNLQCITHLVICTPNPCTNLTTFKCGAPC